VVARSVRDVISYIYSCLCANICKSIQKRTLYIHTILACFIKAHLFLLDVFNVGFDRVVRETRPLFRLGEIKKSPLLHC
jgi:hypothetical protein